MGHRDQHGDMASDYGQPAISNRLHRSGAIDFNVEFATRQAQIFKNPKAPGKRIYNVATDEDSLSVCEAEPLFTPKKHKGNQYTSPDSVRNPVACISSVNGLANPENSPQIFDLQRISTEHTPEALDEHEKAR